MATHRRFLPTTSQALSHAWKAFLTVSTLAMGLAFASPALKRALSSDPAAWIAVPGMAVLGILAFLPIVGLVAWARGPLYQRVEEEMVPEDRMLNIVSLERRYIQRDLRRALKADLKALETQVPSLQPWVARFRNHPDGERFLLWRDKQAVERLMRRYGLTSQLAEVDTEEAHERRSAQMQRAEDRLQRRNPEGEYWVV